MEFLTIIGLIFLTAIIFLFWAAVTVARLIIRAIFGAGTEKTKVAQDANGHVACRHSNCRAMNPPAARYCKRCGKATGFVPQASMRYVA